MDMEPPLRLRNGRGRSSCLWRQSALQSGQPLFWKGTPGPDYRESSGYPFLCGPGNGKNSLESDRKKYPVKLLRINAGLYLLLLGLFLFQNAGAAGQNLEEEFDLALQVSCVPEK